MDRLQSGQSEVSVHDVHYSKCENQISSPSFAQLSAVGAVGLRWEDGGVSVLLYLRSVFAKFRLLTGRHTCCACATCCELQEALDESLESLARAGEEALAIPYKWEEAQTLEAQWATLSVVSDRMSAATACILAGSELLLHLVESGKWALPLAADLPLLPPSFPVPDLPSASRLSPPPPPSSSRPSLATHFPSTRWFYPHCPPAPPAPCRTHSFGLTSRAGWQRRARGVAGWTYI